jgi:HSP20 family protein
MADLIRWDPYRDLLTMRELMDHVFDRSLPNVTSGAWDMNLALDVIENSDEFVVKASIPGINPDDLEITYNDRTLTVKGELKEDKEISEEHYHLRERRFGTFSRSINLPTNIDADHIAANYEAGVLELHLPKTEEAKPRRIQVKGSDKVLAG